MDSPPLGDIIMTEAGKEVAKQAIAPVVTKAKEVIPQLFTRIRDRFAGAALEVADARVNEFDPMLSESCERQAQQAIERGIPVVDPVESLNDPDKFHAFREAVTSVTRTSSADRRRLLADALAIRLQLSSESERALISNIAIELMPRLSQSHLELLGLLAVLFALRPSVARELAATRERFRELDYSVNPHLRGDGMDAAHLARVAEYRAMAGQRSKMMKVYEAELSSYIGFYRLDDISSLNTISHLSSVGCLQVERGVFRKLDRVLGTEGYRTAFLSSAAFRPLRDLWEETLQHLTITPVGLLIGVLVHDQRAHTTFLEAWEWEGLTPVDEVTEGWYGDQHSEEFQALYSQIKRKMQSDRQREKLMGL